MHLIWPFLVISYHHPLHRTFRCRHDVHASVFFALTLWLTSGSRK